MNRKNLTAAVLAGLAGAAGIAGSAQAVNLNPDGLGQVLIYPYYTTNDGNDTLLSVVNTTEEAKAVMKHIHAALSPLGLLSEDYETETLRMWGNFPQAYSHVGLIHAAFAASPRWDDVL